MPITELQAVGSRGWATAASFDPCRRSGSVYRYGDEEPDVIPVSFGVDGTSTLHSTYVLREDGGTERPTAAAESTGFLVY